MTLRREWVMHPASAWLIPVWREVDKRAVCSLCREKHPAKDLNRYGECYECDDNAKARWGF